MPSKTPHFSNNLLPGNGKKIIKGNVIEESDEEESETIGGIQRQKSYLQGTIGAQIILTETESQADYDVEEEEVSFGGTFLNESINAENENSLPSHEDINLVTFDFMEELLITDEPLPTPKVRTKQSI